MTYPILLPLLQDAPATQPAPSALQNLLSGMFVPLALCFVVFWLIILRPEAKNRKKRAAMLAAIGKGDKVMTNGGLYGTVVQVQDGVVSLQVDEGVRLKFASSAIQTVLDDAGNPKV